MEEGWVRVRSHRARPEAPMSNAGWSEDRVTTLSKLWLDGLSASQIARQLGGVTRNAVIGKVHRLGLPDRSTAQSRKAAPSSRLPRPPLHARPVRRTGQAAPTLHSPLRSPKRRAWSRT
jgi:GcrA cell cycle regulator